MKTTKEKIGEVQANSRRSITNITGTYNASINANGEVLTYA